MTKAIAIIGAGYVGLPLAVAFAEAGRTVVCIDSDQRKVEAITAGALLHRGRAVADAGRAGRGGHCSPPARTTPPCAEADAILICLPTPLSTNREPDLDDPHRRHRADRPPPAARPRWWCSSRPPTRARRARCCGRSSRPAASSPARTSTWRCRPSGSTPAAPTTPSTPLPRSSAGSRPACTERALELYSACVEHAGAGQLVRRRRADQAAREHLPVGQHRPRERAGDAVRPHEPERVGGRRSGRHQAVRVHALQARARAWAATACRSTRSTSAGRRASTTSRPSSSSWPARSTSTCPTTAPSASRGR